MHPLGREEDLSRIKCLPGAGGESTKWRMLEVPLFLALYLGEPGSPSVPRFPYLQNGGNGNHTAMGFEIS